MNLEGHGRENLFDDVDLSRTVGWFTSIFPVRLEMPDSGDGWDPGEALNPSKSSCAKSRGAASDTGSCAICLRRRESRRPARTAAVVQLSRSVRPGSWQAPRCSALLARVSGPWHSPEQRRRHLLEVNSLVIDGRLEVRWTYNQAFHAATAVRQLWPTDSHGPEGVDPSLPVAGSRRAHALGFPAGSAGPGRTGPDRRATGATPRTSTLCRRLSRCCILEARAPVQSAFDQWHCTLHGDLDVPAFQRAWEDTLRRHPSCGPRFTTKG